MDAITAIVMTPQAILDFMEAGAPAGRIIIQGFSVPIACPVGATTTWNYRMPAGWVSVARTPYHLTSDFYDVNLIADFLIEEEGRRLAYLPMDGPKDVYLDFMVKRYGMDLVITNNAPVDAIVTVAATAVWLEKSYFDEFYLPLLKALYQAAVEVIRP